MKLLGIHPTKSFLTCFANHHPGSSVLRGVERSRDERRGVEGN